MNTGSGKTIIGLVILKSSLNEGKGPAVYLVPDRQLKTQVEAVATELGIPWTNHIDDASFRQSKSVLITTVHTVYNGLSKFGVQGISIRKVDIGTIIIDDAHACIPIIERQFAISFASSTTTYQKLFELFSESLKQQSLTGHAALRSGHGTDVVPVPYWEWQSQIEDSLHIIANCDDHEEIKFSWPLIQEQLHLCDVAFSPSNVEIRLPYPDLSVVPSYMNAQRRIYMTATLADDSLLIRQMEVDSQCVIDPIVPASASDIGDRLILAPNDMTPKQRTESINLAVQWGQQYNVVVIVPSRYRATAWQNATTEIHDRESIENIIGRLKSSHVGLVVLIARYDGVDLPDDACRVLILDGLPEGYSPQDLVEAVALDGTKEMGVRQIQRIEQGMGRGIRSTDDYCAVILLDPRLVERLYTAASQSQLSPASRAQYELSTAFAATDTGENSDFFNQAVRAFLERDPEWVQASKQAVEKVVYEKNEAISPIAVAESEAFQHAIAGRYVQAKSTLDSVIRSIDDSRLQGWIKQRAAAYLNFTDPENARQLQKSARLDNRYILKIQDETPFLRPNHARSQAEASSTYLTDTYQSAAQFEVGIESILGDLTPSQEAGSHKRFESALEKVGLILGFVSSRPDQEMGLGPDNLWLMKQGTCWVIEAKSEAIATEVTREYMEQLSHSVDWFSSQYLSDQTKCVPLMIHPSRRPKWDAVPRKNARVMTFEKLEKFRDAIRLFAKAIIINYRYHQPEEVRKNLVLLGLAASDLEQRWTEDFLPVPPHR